MIRKAIESACAEGEPVLAAELERILGDVEGGDTAIHLAWPPGVFDRPC